MSAGRREIRFWWKDPDGWPAPPANALAVTGWALALGAIRREQALASVRRADLEAAMLPDRAYAAYPSDVDDVEAFLRAMGAWNTPEGAARQATSALVQIGDRAHPVDLASNVLDVWRHVHDRAGDAHRDACSCLFNCPLLPAPVRVLDEACMRYVEEHHERAAPECFGWSDAAHGKLLRGLIAACGP